MTQQQKPLELTTPVGRLVSGHPMELRAVTDDNDQPKLDKLGQPRTESYIALAFLKTAADWKQEQWGAQILQRGQQDWPNGEWQQPAFAWKIEDGDSQIPNKRGRKNCDREGWPGHWIMKLSTGLGVKCYNVGQYDPLQQIQDIKAIKPGDYGRVVVHVKGNAPSQSPGVYLNPQLFELSQIGQPIILEGGPSAAETFGSSAPAVPANAQTMAAAAPNAVPGAPAPAAPPGTAPAASTPAPPASVPGMSPAPAPAAPSTVQPAPDFLNQAPAPAPAPAAPADPSYNVNGQVFTKSALLASGWTEAAILQLPPA